MIEHSVLLFILIVNILIWLFIAYRIAVRKRDVLHIGVVFALLFVVTYPLKFIASLFGFSVMYPLTLDEKWLYLTVIFFNLSAFAFIVPSLFMKPFQREVSSGHFDNLVNKRKWLLLLIAFTLIVISYGPSAIIAAFSFSADLLQARIEERSEERLGSGLAALIRDTGMILLLISLIGIAQDWLAPNRRLKVMTVGSLLLLFLFFLMLSGSKFLALMPVVSFILFYHMVRIRTGLPQWPFGKVLCYGVIGAILIGITGYVRGFGSLVDESGLGELGQIFVQLANAFDGPDNLAFILARANDVWFGDLSFAPTLQYLTSWFPRFLWPDKPLIYGNLFIQEIYLHERFSGEIGEVISPSMPGEMLVSGGIVFMISWSTMLGFVFRFIYQKAYSSTGWVYPVLYAWLFLNIFNLLRSGTGVVGAFVVFASLVFLVYCSSRILYWATRSVTALDRPTVTSPSTMPTAL